MKLTIELPIQFCKEDEARIHTLELEVQTLSLQELVIYLSKEWEKKLATKSLNVVSTIVVNGRIASPCQEIRDGDYVIFVTGCCGD